MARRGCGRRAKDAAENIMITDLMRNDLSRVCRPGSVRVEELLSVQPHPGVWHLVSTVRGTLTEPTTTADLLAATFPPGSVTGAPKLAAQRGIAELEAEPRGAYTGSIGLVSPGSVSDPGAPPSPNVIIRSFEMRGGADRAGGRRRDHHRQRADPRVVRVPAQGGAAGGRRGRELDPALADEPDPPAAELLAGGVFESVLVVRGSVVRLAGHLARLDRSCRELYGEGLPATSPTGCGGGSTSMRRSGWRCASRWCRPTLACTSRTHVRPVGPRPATNVLRRGRRPARSWRHKWQDRAALQAAERAAVSIRGDALLHYDPFTAGEAVTETSRGNLFWRDVDGIWHTPPLDEQVLPGVTRREVVELLGHRGTPVRIGPGSVADLHRAYGVFWTSSLSGAVPVSAVDGHPLPDVSGFTAELNALLQP